MFSPILSLPIVWFFWYGFASKDFSCCNPHDLFKDDPPILEGQYLIVDTVSRLISVVTNFKNPIRKQKSSNTKEETKSTETVKDNKHSKDYLVII